LLGEAYDAVNVNVRLNRDAELHAVLLGGSLLLEPSQVLDEFAKRGPQFTPDRHAGMAQNLFMVGPDDTVFAILIGAELEAHGVKIAGIRTADLNIARWQ
jgi:hypothetical protein